MVAAVKPGRDPGRQPETIPGPDLALVRGREVLTRDEPQQENIGGLKVCYRGRRTRVLALDDMSPDQGAELLNG